MVRRGGYYYLFYSGDNCCGKGAHYAVMVARSRSATGPFEARAGAILEARGSWHAPGHNSVVEDERGDSWIVYHAVDTNRPAHEADRRGQHPPDHADRPPRLEGRLAGGGRADDRTAAASASGAAPAR